MKEENEFEIEELHEKIQEIEERISILTSDESNEEYENFLDETHEEVKIGELTFSPSRILKELDPTAFRCGKNDWADYELTELETDKQNLLDELKCLESD